MTVLYLLTPARQASGASGAAMSLLIAGIAAFLLVYAQHAATRGLAALRISRLHAP